MRLSAPIFGLGLLGLLWLGPLPALAAQSMSVHMVLHLALVALVPALIAPRLPFSPPPLLLGAAVLLEMVVVWGWHAPAAHHWARTDSLGLALEQASFLGAGLLLWSVALSASRLGGVLVLLVTTMHMTLLGALIGLAPGLLYAVHGQGAFGFSPLEDQQVAGALMAGLGGLIYLVAGLARLAPALEVADSEGTS